MDATRALAAPHEPNAPVISLFVLTLVFLAVWIWGMFGRGQYAELLQNWLHVPLIAAGMCVFMAVGLWVR